MANLVTDGILEYVFSAFVLDLRTFEVLLRTYEVRDEGNLGSLPGKKRQRSSKGSNVQDNSSSPTVMARPCSEAKGHTGYLTFARLKCLAL